MTFSPRHLRKCTTFIALSASGVPHLGAQSARLESGMRIKVGTRESEAIGTLLSRTADSLILRKSDSSTFRVSTAAIRKLDVSHGSSRWLGASRGATIGGALFLIIGASEAVVPSSVCPSCAEEVREAGGAAKFVVSGLAAGAIFGGLIGALVGKERWVSADKGWQVALDVRERRMLLGWRH